MSGIARARSRIFDECRRQVFDAFVFPLGQFGCTEGFAREYVRQALEYSGRIEWDTYVSTRNSFMMRCADLLNGLNEPYVVWDEYRKQMYERFMEGRIRFFEWKGKQERCRLDPVGVGEIDFHNTEMAGIFAHLERKDDDVHFLEGLQIYWDYEQLHMVTWFASQLSLGEGDYSRSRPNHSARITYQRLVNYNSLLWIAAVLGEDRKVILEAVAAAAQRRDWKEKAILIRNRIPFSRIYELALPLAEKERERVPEMEGGYTVEVMDYGRKAM